MPLSEILSCKITIVILISLERIINKQINKFIHLCNNL